MTTYKRCVCALCSNTVLQNPRTGKEERGKFFGATAFAAHQKAVALATGQPIPRSSPSSSSSISDDESDEASHSSALPSEPASPAPVDGQHPESMELLYLQALDLEDLDHEARRLKRKTFVFLTGTSKHHTACHDHSLHRGATPALDAFEDFLQEAASKIANGRRSWDPLVRGLANQLLPKFKAIYTLWEDTKAMKHQHQSYAHVTSSRASPPFLGNEDSLDDVQRPSTS